MRYASSSVSPEAVRPLPEIDTQHHRLPPCSQQGPAHMIGSVNNMVFVKGVRMGFPSLIRSPLYDAVTSPSPESFPPFHSPWLRRSGCMGLVGVMVLSRLHPNSMGIRNGG